jgi:predicted DNA-binding transcriptional regulator YafY
MTLLDYSVPTTRRLVAERFRRVWQLVQTIADEPGHTRFELGQRFHLSERQIQADLNIIRYDMRLPLVRRAGYRFVGEGPTSAVGAFDLREAQLLVLVLSRARGDRSIPRGQLDTLIAKLPGIFPPHVAPLAEQTLRAVAAPRTEREAGIFAALTDALLTGVWVRLAYDHGRPRWYGAAPVVKPELLVPYLGRWYLIAEAAKSSRSIMFDLDGVTAVTAGS